MFDGTAFSLDKVFFICLNSSMNITIAGYGFVGKAYASLLESSYNITIVDPGYPEHDIPIPKDTDAIIICVATPQDADGSCDMSKVDTWHVKGKHGTYNIGNKAAVRCNANL